MEAEVMLLGLFKTFEELEDNLTIAELNLLLKANAKKEERLHRVLAAVNGIKWDSDETTETGEEAMERIKMQARAMSLGKTLEELELEEIGIKIQTKE